MAYNIKMLTVEGKNRILLQNNDVLTHQVAKTDSLLSNRIWHVDSRISSSYSGTGTTWYDINTGSTTNDVTLTNVTYSDPALVYNGTTSVSKSSLVSSSRNNITLECVFKSNDVTSGFQAIIYNGRDNSSIGSGYGLSINQNAGTGNSGELWLLYCSKKWWNCNTYLSNNTYYHVVLAIKNDYNPVVYVNGVEVLNETGSAVLANTPTIETGIGYSSYDLATKVLNGSTVFGAIYNKTLTSTEVTEMYNLHKI